METGAFVRLVVIVGFLRLCFLRYLLFNSFCLYSAVRDAWKKNAGIVRLNDPGAMKTGQTEPTGL